MLSRRLFLGGAAAAAAGVAMPSTALALAPFPPRGFRPLLRGYSAPIDFGSLPVIDSDTVTLSPYEEGVQETAPHIYLEYFNGLFWAMWTSTPHHTEDFGEGQEVMYSTSSDGVSWAAPQQLTGLPASGYRYIARDFWVRDGELFALASRDQIGGYFGSELEMRMWKWTGSAWVYSRRMANNTITNYAPQPLAGGGWGVSRRDRNRKVYFMRGDLGEWQSTVIPFPDGVELSEPSWVALPDGTLSMTLRVQVELGWLYRSLSFDGGATWTEAERTNFPDACSKNCQLRLSDGRYLLISNSKRPDLPNRDRTPLTIAVSDDGDCFDRMAILKQDPPPRHDPDAGSHTPGFMYPDALEKDGVLHVAYTRNKEDIQISRFPLSELP